ncbi:MAG: GNAT family N-acetyltransferase, partial [Actinomycetia bacterium]|nr:GNAT family N-acetyltransferase [Actinomycetes bacterium]
APSSWQWNDFVTTHPKATIFHHPAWAKLLAECYGFRPFVLVTYDQSGNLSAGQPFLVVRSLLTGYRWISLPYSDYCNPLYTDPSSLERLTDKLVQLSQNKKTPRLSVRWNLPARSSITSYSHYALHQLALGTSAEWQEQRLSRMHRKNIRAAQRNGVRVEQGTSLEHTEEFYRLQLQTRHRKGLPAQPWRFFRLLKELVFDQDLGFILLAYREEECLAGMVCLHWQQLLMCKYAASREEALKLRPNNLLFWTAIRWGIEHGYEVLDMGRSALENTGLREFKTRWGATEQPLVYSTLAGSATEKRDGHIMRVLNTVIRNSPVWMSRITGEFLYRHFD